MHACMNTLPPKCRQQKKKILFFCRNLGSQAYRTSGQFGFEIGPFGTKLSPHGAEFRREYNGNDKNGRTPPKSIDKHGNLKRNLRILKNLKIQQKTKKLKHFVWGVKNNMHAYHACIACSTCMHGLGADMSKTRASRACIRREKKASIHSRAHTCAL